MDCTVLNAKGQISLEFILIVVIILIYVQTVILPVSSTALNAADDVTRLSQARKAAQDLTGTINYIGAVPGTSAQTITIFIPKNTAIHCYANPLQKIGFEVNLNTPAFACPDALGTPGTHCDKNFTIPSNTYLECAVPSIYAGGNGFAQHLKIEKKYDPQPKVTVEPVI
ncbi:MAG: hypothetical protein HY393_00245 [Candidatus Diapherotrites archaeon]|nr:hypothetical protein [Candidatus Diapherotrites archaeon]